jgi:8-oxo-dGTP pyrophosphatase MutT (NUDIX family)
VGKNTQNQTILITREFSSGGIVFKKLKDKRQEIKVFWLIRKTAASKVYPNQYWMLPKGRVDDTDGDLPGPMASGIIKADETSLRNAALREVAEETGEEAKIVEKIGTIKYLFTDPARGRIMKFVTFYLMEWVRDLPEGFDGETSEIAWLPFDKALETLSFRGEKQVLKKAREFGDCAA